VKKGRGQHAENPHWGTSVDMFLNEDGIREAAKAEAVTREMERQGKIKAASCGLNRTEQEAGSE